MPTPSIFALLRQALAHAKFDSSETRAVINEGIDSLERANNDTLGLDLEEHEDVSSACETITSHLSELLGSPITTAKEDSGSAVLQFSDNEDDDPIERR